MREGFPPIEALIPHRGEAVLLSKVVSHTPDETVCAAHVEPTGLYASADGNVPAVFSVEYLAQVVAVHAGLAVADEGAPRIGLLLGARDYRIAVPCLGSKQELLACARRVWGSAAGLVAFDCELRDERTGAVLARGRLSCYLSSSRVATEAPR